MKWLVEEADYKATTELFGKKKDDKTLENFIPKSESDFLEYAELVSYKLRPYEEVASSVTEIANEKLKAEKEANAGKKKIGVKKKQLHVDKPDDDLAVAAYDDVDDCDFM